jgi:hypothetical protein
MPPDGYNSLTVSDEAMWQLALVMTKYDCESLADAVSTASMPLSGMKQRWRRFLQIGWQIDMLNDNEIDTVSREPRCLVDTELTYCKSSMLRRLNPRSNNFLSRTP